MGTLLKGENKVGIKKQASKKKVEMYICNKRKSCVDSEWGCNHAQAHSKEYDCDVKCFGYHPDTTRGLKGTCKIVKGK